MLTAAVSSASSIPLEWVPNIGATGIVTLVVVLVLTGKLVPGREMRYWREAFFEEQRQKRELMEVGRTAQDVLKALPKAARGGRGD